MDSLEYNDAIQLFNYRLNAAINHVNGLLERKRLDYRFADQVKASVEAIFAIPEGSEAYDVVIHENGQWDVLQPIHKFLMIHSRSKVLSKPIKTTLQEVFKTLDTNLDTLLQHEVVYDEIEVEDDEDQELEIAA